MGDHGESDAELGSGGEDADLSEGSGGRAGDSGADNGQQAAANGEDVSLAADGASNNSEPDKGNKSNEMDETPGASNVRSRLRRKPPQSLAGRESKLSKTYVELGKAINAEYKQLNVTQSRMTLGLSLDELYDACDAMDINVGTVSDKYKELVELCKINENKILDKTQTMYDLFISQANKLNVAINERMDVLEEEAARSAERIADDTSRALEEEARIFESLLKEGEELSLAATSKDQTTVTVTTPRNPTDTGYISTPASASIAVSIEQGQGRPRPAQTPNSYYEDHGTTLIPTPTSTEELPYSDPKTDSNPMADLIKGLAGLVDNNRKSIEPEIFQGDVLKFSDWEIDLDTYYKSERVTDHYRLRYLKKFIAGDARKCIESYFITNTNAAYLSARATLKERYGNEYTIARTFRKKLEDWPPVKPRDASGLREFSDYLCYLLSTMQSTRQLSILDDCIENERMVAKVPDWLRLKWARTVAKTQQAEKQYPKFHEFVALVKEEAYIMNLEISKPCNQDRPKDWDRPQRSIRTYQTTAADSTMNLNNSCLFCKMTNHQAADCFKLHKLSKEEKGQVIMERGLCFKCLEHGHRSRDCMKRKQCLICAKAHATVNHDPTYNPRSGSETSTQPYNTPGNNTWNTSTTAKPTKDPSPEQKTPSESKELTCQATGSGNIQTSMAVPVYVSAGTGREILVYALLDNMSDACYVSTEVIKLLNANASDIETDVTIHTINGPVKADIERFDDLILRGYTTDSYAQISAYNKNHVYCKREQLPDPDKARRVTHLASIADQIPPLMDIPVGLLIGSDHSEVIQPIQTRPAPPGTTGLPFAVRTLFGWTVCGGMNGNTRKCKHAYKTDTSKELMDLLEKDFQDTEKDESCTSQNDLKFLKIMESSIKQNADGNYVMPLPFKEEVQLPDNKSQVERRFRGIMRKFRTDDSYHQEYREFIEDLIKAGHAEEAPADSQPGKKWYIPHFSVRHKQKKKLRVVFDASASCKGVALNDLLLRGPDHMNSLIGILLRFRKEPVAITCDIQQMFYNFLVEPEHRDYLRFLWADTNLETVKEYRMNVHLFGATSSPAVATFGLRHLADDHRSISIDAADFIKNDFYVDDGVTSVSSTQEAQELIRAATEICSKANIRLHKFLSNEKDVLSSVAQSERGECARSINILQDKLPSDRTLGMEWCLDSDTFHFKLPEAQPNHNITKRNLLATIAKIYDPMGLISPFILKGKKILQRATVSDLSWDQLLSQEDTEEWKIWLRDLENITKFQVKRCIKPTEAIASIELHHFGDASTQGYGACSYVRYITDNGEVTCNLLLSKSRVAPLKKITTIPRLELQGAVTAVRLANVIRKEFRLEVDREFFWTDSSIVLGYIRNESKRFHTYVANRVADIGQSSIPSQWHHVDSNDNPADIASRGASTKELLVNTKWLSGPAFLNSTCLTTYIKSNQIDAQLHDNDPEVRHLTAHASSMTSSIASRFTRYSSWKKLIKSMAILRACVRTKKRSRKDNAWKLHILTREDLQTAEEFIIRTAQEDTYESKEKEQSIAKLNPLLDDKGIIRVGGRANSAMSWNYSQIHPIIIPKKSSLAETITRHYHEEVCHLGQRSTLAAVREAGYWIINGTGAAKRVIGNCVTCHRLRGKPELQMMGELPAERLEKTAPFTNIGIDAFGPFYVKDRRSEMKRWGLLISCLYSRAIHIELLEDMTTDCLIQALRCFMSLRGPVSTIICDNGTNFVGMKNKLAKETDMADKDLGNYLLQNQIVFKFNSPEASHQGGATERMIRSARAVLNGMSTKYKYRMDTKTLRTAFYEAASIVNNRPLTGTAIRNVAHEIMTPNRLLTGKYTPLVAPPPGKFTPDDMYSTNRWKVSQAIAEDFWKAWRAEYLTHIMKRQKWLDAQKNAKVGDIVLVKEDNISRNDWKIGRIEEIYPGNDGLVRNISIVMSNQFLDGKGKPHQPTTTLKRPIQKIVILVSI